MSGASLIFGPDPEFCFALLTLCNSKGYKLTALLPDNSTITPRLLNDLQNFGATIVSIEATASSKLYEIPTTIETSEISALGQMAWEKANHLAKTEGAINLMDIVINQSEVFDAEIDRFIEEIATSGIIPNVFIGESDHYGILRRLLQAIQVVLLAILVS